jgi:hypothetical protein
MADTARRFRAKGELDDEICTDERHDTPGAWTVEAYLKDGAIDGDLCRAGRPRRAATYLRSQYREIIGPLNGPV